jgi:DNA modification methylase
MNECITFVPDGYINVHVGDCRAVLKSLPDQKYDMCITSPPYFNQRDYGVDGQLGLENTPEQYLTELVEVFMQVHRVLKDDGTLWLNMGDGYANRAYPEMTIKPRDMFGLPWRLALRLQQEGWYLRQDIIWCLSGGTRVYARTQKGDMPMTIKDMVRLNPATVQLWNGNKWTQVLGWGETPRPERTYEIELRSGQRIGCTGAHLWPTQRGNVRADELIIGDIIASSILPEPTNVKTPLALGDEQIGWFVGMYIAEGCKRDGCIRIAAHIKEVGRLEKLQSLAAAYHGGCRQYVDSDNGCTINLTGSILGAVLDTYVSGEFAAGKHLSSRCWERSNIFLRALLLGYLEGDGSYELRNDRWRLGFCANDQLASDLRTLAARLGISLRLRRTSHKLNGKEFLGYRGALRFTPSTHHNAKPDFGIIAIRGSNARKFWDISVEDEPHLFALASGVLTHNSKPDTMPEPVKTRCVRSHEYLFLLAKQPHYHFDFEAIRERGVTGSTTGSPQRDTRLTHGKQSGGNGGINAAKVRMAEEFQLNGFVMRNKRSVWRISAQQPGVRETHFATFPPDLVRPCMLAGSRVDGWVLDPFGGSGTTGMVARELGRRADLIELNPDYAKLATDRCA